MLGAMQIFRRDELVLGYLIFHAQVMGKGMSGHSGRKAVEPRQVSIRRSVTPHHLCSHWSCLCVSPALLATFTAKMSGSFRFHSILFFSFLFSGKSIESEREEKTREGGKKQHTLIGKGFQPLLFHLSGFISALILDFLVHPSHIHKNWRFHSLGGQDYSNKTVS